MSLYSPSIEKLIENFERLPSIGHKTAIRLAYHMLDMNEQEIAEFTNAITEAKQKLKYVQFATTYQTQTHVLYVLIPKETHLQYV